jgi:hypothetical protein
MSSRRSCALGFCLSIAVLILVAGLDIRTTPVASVNAPRLETRVAARGAPKSIRRLKPPQLLKQAHDDLPLSFEANEGQADASVRYISHGSDSTVFLTETEAVISLKQRTEDDPLSQRLDTETRRKLAGRKFGRVLMNLHARRRNRIVHIGVDGASTRARLEPLGELPGKTDYFIGNDPRKWHSGIPNYARVRYAGIYPGVDLIYYGNRRQLEFDFVVSPGADPNKIALKFGADEQHLALTHDGSLRVGSRQNAVLLHRPVIYQTEHGRRRLVQGKFVLRADRRVGIRVGTYDRNKPLIIDPVLAYSTYLAGSGGDDSDGIAVDSSGNVYVAGATVSPDFPTVNGYQSAGSSNYLAFVAEFDPTGTTLLYSTYLGGTGQSECYATGIAIDANANVYVTGYSFSTDFPVVNGFQTSNNSPTYGNAFVARIDTTQTGAASLVYSTYLGGGGDAQSSNLYFADVAFAIAADSSGRAYVVGLTASDTSVAPFPTTPSAYQSSLSSQNGNAFLTVLDTNQIGDASLAYSTYLGGDGPGSIFGDIALAVAVDSNGDAYLVGETTSDASGPFPTTASAFQPSLNSPDGNAFLTEIDTSQSGSQSLVYSTYFGGSTTNPLGDADLAITLDSVGKVYVAGSALSSDFPVTSGAFQTTNSSEGKAFIAKFDLTQSGAQSLVYSTLLGGMNSSLGDWVNGMAVDAGGDAFAVGQTSSTDFPTTADAFQSTPQSAGWNPFVTELNSNGTDVLYSTYLGGSSAFGDVAMAVALDSLGNAYLTGYTFSSDFPTTAGAFQTTANLNPDSGFVTKLAFSSNPGISVTTSPLPNTFGWNSSPVRVMFSCIPGVAPVETCSSPVTVSTEGADQVISGTVVDTANNATTSTVTLNIDTTPPSLTVRRPRNGASVHNSVLMVTGSVSDQLSGVKFVTCNGAPATVRRATFLCWVALVPGANSVDVAGSDLAGNTAMISLTVAFFPPHTALSPPLQTRRR